MVSTPYIYSASEHRKTQETTAHARTFLQISGPTARKRNAEISVQSLHDGSFAWQAWRAFLQSRFFSTSDIFASLSTWGARQFSVMDQPILTDGFDFFPLILNLPVHSSLLQLGLRFHEFAPGVKLCPSVILSTPTTSICFIQ